MTVIERLHSLANRPCGSTIAGCIQTLSDRQLPSRVLDIASFYATSDPDPKTDIWQDTSANAYGGEPYSHGINCVRGQAAEAIASLLYRDEARLEFLRPALIALSQDPIISVRTRAINAFMPLLNFARDEAVELFLEACEGCAAICATPPFERFIHYAVYTHYSHLRELLKFALGSDNEDAVENAARQIVLADLDEIDVGSDASNIRSGTETMRKAATTVYASNLAHERARNKCAEHLEEFFDDDSEKVRQEVSRSFFRLSGTRLLELESVIEQFIESRSFENETDRLLHALEESNIALPQIICRAAERVLEFLGEAGTHIASHGSMVAQSIAKGVLKINFPFSDKYPIDA